MAKQEKLPDALDDIEFDLSDDNESEDDVGEEDIQIEIQAAPKEEPDDDDDEETDQAIEEEVVQARNRAGFQIMSGVQATTYLNAMFYGAAGAGKTTLAASASLVPEMRDVLMLSAESGHMSIAHMNVDIIPLSDFKTLSKIIRFIKKHVQAREAGDIKMLAKLQKQAFGYPDDYKMKKSEVRQYKTIIVDSLTELHKYGMYNELGMDLGTYDLDEDLAQTTYSHWGNTGEKIRYLIRTLRDLPINALFIAGESISKDDNQAVTVTPMLPGRLSTEVSHFLDFVGYMRNKTVPQTEDNPAGIERLVYYHPNDRLFAKTRIQGFSGKPISEPTMADIMAPLLKARE